jgi:hypothetical protein
MYVWKKLKPEEGRGRIFGATPYLIHRWLLPRSLPSPSSDSVPSFPSQMASVIASPSEFGYPLNEEEFVEEYEYVHEGVQKPEFARGTYYDYGLGYPEDCEEAEAEAVVDRTEWGGEAPEECVYDESTGLTLTWGGRLEEYPPIKAIGPRPVYHGPHPPGIGHELCGLHYYLEKGIESILITNDAEQATLRRWLKVRNEMHKIQLHMDEVWLREREPHKVRFYTLMDRLSTWGCYLCEYANHVHEGGFQRHYCVCDECDGCGSKYCGGCYSEED